MYFTYKCMWNLLLGPICGRPEKSLRQSNTSFLSQFVCDEDFNWMCNACNVVSSNPQTNKGPTTLYTWIMQCGAPTATGICQDRKMLLTSFPECVWSQQKYRMIYYRFKYLGSYILLPTTCQLKNVVLMAVLRHKILIEFKAFKLEMTQSVFNVKVFDWLKRIS